MATLGFLEVGGWVETAKPAAVARRIDELIHAPGTLRRMSESGRRRIDGRGAERVAAELVRLL